MARLTDRPDMTLDVYRGRKTTMQQKSFGRSSGRESNSDKQEKRSNDPIKMANKYGVLDDNDMEISH